jgi:DNA-binding protein H-NS
LPTLAELQKQIAELRLEADRLRKAERVEAIAKVREMVEEFGLTPEDIFRRSGALSYAGKRKEKIATHKPPKYRDPGTGRTWNGVGKPPSWIAGVDDRERFRLQTASSSQEDGLRTKEEDVVTSLQNGSPSQFNEEVQDEDSQH